MAEHGADSRDQTAVSRADGPAVTTDDPAVTTDDPDGFVGEEVGQFVDLRDNGAAACLWLASLQFLKNKALISRHYLI